MEIAFEQKSLRQLCEDERTAERELGKVVAAKLRRRLADIRAVERIAQLPVGNPFAVGEPSRGCMGIELGEGYLLIFCANHNKLPIDPSGDVDWLRVSRIRILGVEKYVFH